MAGLVGYGKTGTLTVGGLVLNGPAWDVQDVTPLWHLRDWFGDNAGLAGADGTRAGRRRMNEASVVLSGIVIGHATPLGVPIADAAEGMFTNQGLLRAALMDPMLVDGDPSVACSLVLPGAAESLEGDVQCDLRFGAIAGSQSWRFSRAPFALGLIIPAGLLTLATGS